MLPGLLNWISSHPDLCIQSCEIGKDRKTWLKEKKANQAVAIAELIDALNEDLAREYQAIIAYTVYSSVLTGANG